jgi:hypothetical protein
MIDAALLAMRPTALSVASMITQFFSISPGFAKKVVFIISGSV